MNGNAIIVDYNLFNSDCHIYVMKDGQRGEFCNAPCGVPELIDKLVAMAQQHQIYNIRVNGPFAIMGEIKRAIAEYELHTYNENKITVEGL